MAVVNKTQYRFQTLSKHLIIHIHKADRTQRPLIISYILVKIQSQK